MMEVVWGKCWLPSPGPGEAPSSARQSLKCCINTEQLPGSSVFLKDFDREKNMIFLYKNKVL